GDGGHVGQGLLPSIVLAPGAGVSLSVLAFSCPLGSSGGITPARMWANLSRAASSARISSTSSGDPARRLSDPRRSVHPAGGQSPVPGPGAYSGGIDSMTSPFDARQRSTARLTRRQFLQAGGIGALTIGLPGTVAASVEPGRGLSGRAADRSCIFVLLCGGPSHIDTWDLKPDAP